MGFLKRCGFSNRDSWGRGAGDHGPRWWPAQVLLPAAACRCGVAVLARPAPGKLGGAHIRSPALLLPRSIEGGLRAAPQEGGQARRGASHACARAPDAQRAGARPCVSPGPKVHPGARCCGRRSGCRCINRLERHAREAGDLSLTLQARQVVLPATQTQWRSWRGASCVPQTSGRPPSLLECHEVSVRPSRWRAQQGPRRARWAEDSRHTGPAVRWRWAAHDELWHGRGS